MTVHRGCEGPSTRLQVLHAIAQQEPVDVHPTNRHAPTTSSLGLNLRSSVFSSCSWAGLLHMLAGTTLYGVASSRLLQTTSRALVQPTLGRSRKKSGPVLRYNFPDPSALPDELQTFSLFFLSSRHSRLPKQSHLASLTLSTRALISTGFVCRCRCTHNGVQPGCQRHGCCGAPR